MNLDSRARKVRQGRRGNRVRRVRQVRRGNRARRVRQVLSASPEAGVYAVKTDQGRQIFLMGHAEYDRDTLRSEYMRDRAAGLPIRVPANYFPDDDPNRKPVVSWRSCAHLLYSNWLNYFVYQTTPYDIRGIERGVRTDD